MLTFLGPLKGDDPFLIAESFYKWKYDLIMTNLFPYLKTIQTLCRMCLVCERIKYGNINQPSTHHPHTMGGDGE